MLRSMHCGISATEINVISDCKIDKHNNIFQIKFIIMKHVITVLSSFFCYYFTVAQNVGIGTTAPVTKLNIMGAKSDAAIPGNTSSALFRIGVSANEGIDFGKMGSSPYSGWMQAGISGITADPLSIQPLGGNVGIGTVSPTEKLHLIGNSLFNGTMKLQGLNLFEFGSGVAGKEVNAGKIGYNAFGHNALTFVGAGTNASNRAIYFFAEGGTVTNGPLDFNGPLRINGNPGTTGQVLTSNGTGTAQWSNSSFSNPVRFAVQYTTEAYIGAGNTYTTVYYNTSPADVTITSNTITVNKTGLYHFEGDATGNLLFSTAPSPISFSFGLIVKNMHFKFLYTQDLEASTYPQRLKTIHFSQDVYITAPAIIEPEALVGYGSGGSNVSRSADGIITGYLISE